MVSKKTSIKYKYDYLNGARHSNEVKKRVSHMYNHLYLDMVIAFIVARVFVYVPRSHRGDRPEYYDRSVNPVDRTLKNTTGTLGS